MSGGDQSIKARQSEIELFRQTKQKHTQARIQTETDLNVLNTTLGARMEGKFEFIANYCCALQFDSIVSGWARERCRMCDRNLAEFSISVSQIFPQKQKDFFLQSRVCVPRRTCFGAPPPPSLIQFQLCCCDPSPHSHLPTCLPQRLINGGN